MTAYVYSTLTNHQNYNIYFDGVKGQPPTIAKHVFVAGQANLTNQNFITPKGVVTEVSDEDMELLEKCPSFLDHQKNGFILVEKGKVKSTDLESIENKAKSQMADKDNSAPIDEKKLKEEELTQGVDVTVGRSGG